MFKRSSSQVEWRGNLRDGAGWVSTESGAVRQAHATWEGRTGTQLFRRRSATPATNPEELLAAAHATDFSMEFAHKLDQAGYEPHSLHTTANCFLEKQDLGGVAIKELSIEVTGEVPNIESVEFERIAEKAAAHCPMSHALNGNVSIHVTARLASAVTV